MTTIIPPEPLTAERWRALSTSRHSLIRSLQYEVVAGLKLRGMVLDVGGGSSSDYHDWLDVSGTIETVNISADMHPTYIADLNQPLAIDSDKYDAVLSLNTLEHIRRDQLALSEIYRVLKVGGECHILIPFLARVHGSPDDYHRHTGDGWADMLVQAGFDLDAIRIHTLNAGGSLTAALSIMEFEIPRRIRRPIKRLVLLWALLRNRRPPTLDFPLVYYLYAVK